MVRARVRVRGRVRLKVNVKVRGRVRVRARVRGRVRGKSKGPRVCKGGYVRVGLFFLLQFSKFRYHPGNIIVGTVFLIF